LDNSDPSATAWYSGLTMAGVELPTDPDLIEDMAFGGESTIDDFYTPDLGASS
jgi:hypothetical protein